MGSYDDDTRGAGSRREGELEAGEAAVVTRRQFVAGAAAATGALALGSLAGCGDEGGGASSQTPGDPPPTEPDPQPGGEPEPHTIEEGAAVVSITGYADVEQAVRRAVELAGGLEEIQPGDTVFIKTNAVHGFVAGLPGIVTSNAVLAAVVRLVKERDPGWITVGDRSARQHDSAAVLDASGQGEAAMAAGADEIYPAPSPEDGPDDWVMVQPPLYEETWAEEGGVLAMRRIVEADHFINVPVCKNHEWAVFSLSMKNLIGAIGDDSRDPLHYAERMPERLSRDIALLNQPFDPLLNILDARAALINGGPGGVGADTVRTSPGLVMASRDRVALDVAGVSLLKLELSRNTIDEPDWSHPFLTADESPWLLPQIVHGAELGLGMSGPEGVILCMEEVADAEAIEAIFRS